MRCLAFADGLGGDARPLFVARAFESRVAEAIRCRGYEVEELALEVTVEEDARLTRKIAERTAAQLIVTDLCHRAALEDLPALEAYHRLLARDFFVVSFAEGNLIDLPGEIMVSPYLRTSYPAPAAGVARLRLVGPQYFIFRREFTVAARAPRTISREGRRVLVTVGGTDDLGLTARIVRAVRALADAGLSFRIVLGPAYSSELERDVEALLVGFQGECVLLNYDTNVAEAMLWADLAVSGDGLTKYETAVTGTPSIMLSRPGSEKFLNEEFEKAGSTLHAGDGSLIDIDVLAELIQRVLRDAPLRARMSERGKAMVDGRGLERVLEHIPPVLLR
jgi:spore coat polysaccharide biosynthesis predicted glycosyltransferase SpsG